MILWLKAVIPSYKFWTNCKQKACTDLDDGHMHNASLTTGNSLYYTLTKIINTLTDHLNK